MILLAVASNSTVLSRSVNITAPIVEVLVKASICLDGSHDQNVSSKGGPTD